MKRRALLAFASLTIALPSHAGFLIDAQGEPDELLLGDRREVLTDADGTFFAWRRLDGTVEIRFDGHGQHVDWEVDFRAPRDRTLVPGPYEHAGSTVSRAPADPGLWITRDHSSCGAHPGRFDVREAVFGSGGEVVRFAADFEMRCAPEYGALHGTVYYDASGPPFAPPPDTDADGILDASDLCVTTPDPAQLDADADGLGDACDPSFDNTFFLLDSRPGDYIGQGRRIEVDLADADFQVGLQDGTLNLLLWGESVWLASFGAIGGPLAVGSYDASIGGNGGLNIGGEGRGCGVTDTRGRFDVLEIDVGPTGVVNHFAADFLQRCGARGAPAVGAIRYRASPELGLPADSDGDGVFDLADDCVGAPDPDQVDSDLDGIGDACDPELQATYIRTNSTFYPGSHLFTVADGPLDAQPNRSGVYFSFWGDDAYVTMDLAAPYGSVLVPGVYEDAGEYPYAALSLPSLSLFPCGGSGGGRFEVLEAEYDAEGYPLHFAADFEYACGSGPKLTGSVRWASSFYPRDGDSDGDGVDDPADTCPWTPDPTQRDADGDGRGDVCQPCDANADGAVDRADIQAIATAIGLTPEAGDVRDADADGAITVLDARQCANRCDRENCETPSLVPEPAVCAGTLAAIASLSAIASRRRSRSAQ